MHGATVKVISTNICKHTVYLLNPARTTDSHLKRISTNIHLYMFRAYPPPIIRRYGVPPDGGQWICQKHVEVFDGIYSR
jgi:hypothetical protein